MPGINDKAAYKISNKLCNRHCNDNDLLINNYESNSEVTSKASESENIKQLSTTTSQSCQLIDEEVSYNLNKKVPQWSVEYVLKWFKQIGFSDFANNLLENQVDGDLLLRLTEDELKYDIGIHNGIMKKRIMRELYNLKKSADYSDVDPTGLNSVLKSINSEYSVYTYPMFNAGIDKDSMKLLTDDQLKNVCGISNDIHRSYIIASIRKMPVYIENMDKPYDAFISYRRSDSSVLASLLKVYLKIRGYNVFIDVKRSNDIKYRNNVLQTIKQSKNFIIVLTQDSFDKQFLASSKEDIESLDIINKEVITAKQSQCNIIPVLNNFSWSSFVRIPDDLKNLEMYNSINWVHEYQDACVNKLVKFMIK
ncbi:sterile alpha and TIR motif-containing protein 1-like [Melanaphis sacchari]|uniref:Sterile alpha and TIR motif-containing protein 1 n=1 Tax=Melanaphis sacchari TaxID=742174 RepID=A0A2H8TX27_9HEMI|nr:sterile alpha and TIR motif-containing protein 1-like [Melanaphis sacchari]